MKTEKVKIKSGVRTIKAMRDVSVPGDVVKEMIGKEFSALVGNDGFSQVYVGNYRWTIPNTCFTILKK